MPEDPRLLNRDSPEYKAANRAAAVDRVRKLLATANHPATQPEEAENARRLAKIVIDKFGLKITEKAQQPSAPRPSPFGAWGRGKPIPGESNWQSDLSSFKSEAYKKPRDEDA